MTGAPTLRAYRTKRRWPGCLFSSCTVIVEEELRFCEHEANAYFSCVPSQASDRNVLPSTQELNSLQITYLKVFVFIEINRFHSIYFVRSMKSILSFRTYSCCTCFSSQGRESTLNYVRNVLCFLFFFLLIIESD